MAIGEFEFERMLNQELGVRGCNLYAGKLDTATATLLYSIWHLLYKYSHSGGCPVITGFVTGSHDSCISHNQPL